MACGKSAAQGFEHSEYNLFSFYILRFGNSFNRYAARADSVTCHYLAQMSMFYTNLKLDISKETLNMLNTDYLSTSSTRAAN